jgi:hypothetical protein
MSNVGWFGWVDILSEVFDLELNRRVWGVIVFALDNLSIEYGVFIGGCGRGSKCRAISERRA